MKKVPQQRSKFAKKTSIFRVRHGNFNPELSLPNMNCSSSVLVIFTAAVGPKLSCLSLKAAITDIFGMLVCDCFNVHAYEQSL